MSFSLPPRKRSRVSASVIGEKTVVAQGLARHCDCEIVFGNHDPARQNANAAFQNAHIYVHFKGRYTLALKQRFGEGNFGRVGWCAEAVSWG